MVQIGPLTLGRYIYDRFGIEFTVAGGFNDLLAAETPPLTLYTLQVLIPVVYDPSDQQRSWVIVTTIMDPSGREICEANNTIAEVQLMAEHRTRRVTVNAVARFENHQFNAFGQHSVSASIQEARTMSVKGFYVGPSEGRHADIARIGGTGVGVRH